eukprot:TRINITY_DN4502_c0_g1_i1.p1 TRINITY_DN4502_c0_g1~~TRINITY_DN4502_c0_g1_i1.p1  ORF type:complete len:498 (+),score=113.84 TRINITY_DN4502_c0_g1_i1:31-1494(+)
MSAILIDWEGGLLFQYEYERDPSKIWNRGGPTLPIEFSCEIDGGLFPVIDQKNGIGRETLWKTIEFEKLGEMEKNLKQRYGFSNDHHLGYIKSSQASKWTPSDVIQIIGEWIKENNFENDSIYFCDLKPNMKEYSPNAAISYLESSKDKLKHICQILQSKDYQTPIVDAVQEAFLTDRIIQNAHFQTLYTASSDGIDNVKRWISSHTYCGRNQYCEYIEGNIPIVLGVPHGGFLKPNEISNRTSGVLEGDDDTIDLALKMFISLVNVCSKEENIKLPHIVINHLDRIKMDANRNMKDAIEQNSKGQQFVEQTWREYHTFIDVACRKASTAIGFAHFFDIHGNDMSIKTMLGYLTRKVIWENEMSELIADLSKNSMRNLVAKKKNQEAVMDLFTGKNSLGHWMLQKGFECTPYGDRPFDWGGKGYYNGGYTTLRHGSYYAGNCVNATQFETPKSVRANEDIRRRYGEAFSLAVVNFFQQHYHFNLRDS